MSTIFTRFSFFCFFIFVARVPRLKNSGYQFLGLILSEKSWVYLLATQLLLSGGLRSLVPAISGYLVGHTYNLDYCSMQTYRFPRFIEVRTSVYIALILFILLHIRIIGFIDLVLIFSYLVVHLGVHFLLFCFFFLFF